jgi:RecB family exonuclease
MLSKLFARFAGLFSPGIEISYSRINAYLTCPQKYKLVYQEGQRVPSNPFIALGLSVHRALEDFHANHKSGGLGDLLESYDKSWVNEGFTSPQQTQDFYEKGQRMLENYYEGHADSKTEILFIEKEFSFPLGKNRLRGIIDRIDRHPDGVYEVIDYKTHNELWSQAKVDSDLQLSIYCLACREALGFAPGLLSYYFLAHDRRMSTQRSDAQLDRAVSLIGQVAGKIVKKDFTPNRVHCPRCDFKKTCPHSTFKKQ